MSKNLLALLNNQALGLVLLSPADLDENRSPFHYGSQYKLCLLDRDPEQQGRHVPGEPGIGDKQTGSISDVNFDGYEKNFSIRDTPAEFSTTQGITCRPHIPSA